MREEERSPEARARAESALVRLLHEIGDEAPFLVVLGGLVPAVLAADTAGVIPEHLGTTDIDILLVSHIDPGADLGVVERALEALQFEPDPEQDGWRWQGTSAPPPSGSSFSAISASTGRARAYDRTAAVVSAPPTSAAPDM